MADCVRCERPMTADTAYACSTCAGHLATDLERAAGLLPELDVTVTRQAVTGGGSGRPSGEMRLAFDLDASHAADTVENTITTWARLVSEERGIPIQPCAPEHARTFAGPICRERAYFGHCEHGVCRDATPPPREPGDPLVEAVQFLGAQVEWLRHQRFADEAVDELGYACWLLRSTVDRRPDRVYLGQCWAPTDVGECQEDVYAPAGASYATCRMCGSTWDVHERRAWLLRAARDTLATATQLAYALSWFTGRRLAPATVRSWALRGRILAKGRDRAGDPTYRVGDGEELMMSQVKHKIATLVDAGALLVQRLRARAEVCPAPASSPAALPSRPGLFVSGGESVCPRPSRRPSAPPSSPTSAKAGCPVAASPRSTRSASRP